VANFTTHLNVSAFVSGVGATFVAYNSLATKEESFLYFLTGIIGGILPDIDHDNSTILKIMQFFFSNLIAFLVLYKYINSLPILNLALIWGVIYLLISIVIYFFKKLTTHRGAIHSIPAGLFFALCLVLFSYYYLGFDVKKSYFLGVFLFIGYVTHLILDEIYSVDLTGKKIKKSFGSAFKLCSKNRYANILLLSSLIVMFLFLPQKTYMFKFFKGLIHV